MRKSVYHLLISITVASPPLANAIEPWADANLPVTNALQLWLSAAQENQARIHGSRIPVREGGRLDVWHDASGKKYHVRQAADPLRPLLFQFPAPAVRFDGTDDFLSAAGLDSESTEATIFLRATVRANSGNFRAFLSFNRSGANDFESGINFDLGPKGGKSLDSINLEGHGFVGAKDLLDLAVPFGTPHTFSVVTRAGSKGVQVWLDGLPQGARDRRAGKLSLEELAVGARVYSHSASPPHAQGFFEGDIAEVLVYNRALSDAERGQVENYLATKYVPQDFAGRKPVPLEAVSNVPPVQVFMPGFIVRELPVALPNINNVKYRPDGKLVALGYDGRVWLLTDSDGDGLEDRTNVFWDKSTIIQSVGMALTPPNYARGDGVFVTAREKIVLLVDTNRNDAADSEIVVAKDWQPQDFNHGVDATGMAVDRDGTVYFGIGTGNFVDAYRVGTNGVARYDLKGDRSTIQKVSPDFSRRETVCTGIRFPVGLAFNAAGDLFCSDQEGATWMPNGNPLDELLHIRPGRHYGFPPRHPKHLPDVIDEPSEFDYGPQHQSTCGLNFNEPVVSGGPVFGPARWRGNAIMSGYSRGKLWRTKLVKTPAGYVAQNQLFASLNMLTADACVSPKGELVVAVHSGAPDWGTGPKGAGKLYKISYADQSAPQPVLIWAASESETCIEFDRTLDPARLKDLAKSVTVTEGRYAGAGDRFEVLRPGYQVVQNQVVSPRYELEIVSTGLSADGRTLSIRTVPRARALNYAVSLPKFSHGTSTGAAEKNILPQHDAIDLAHDLTGVEASWQSSDGKTSWSGWLPHLDLAVSRAFTEGSEAHRSLQKFLKQPGRLTLKAQLDLGQMLRAATQPGSKLDFEYPPETVTLVFKSSGKLGFHVSGNSLTTSSSIKGDGAGGQEGRMVVKPAKDKWLSLEVHLTTAANVEPKLEISWFTAEDPRPRALPLRRMFMPWAKPAETPAETERRIPEIAGGNWVNGKKLFFSEQTACSKCHAVAKRGGKIGPDLSNLLHRDYASVMKDITQPSAAINPDHVAYNIQLKSDEVHNGVPAGEEGENLMLADAAGRLTPVPRKQITSMKPSAISLMPEGLLNALSPQQVKDLLTFLLMPAPLAPAALEISGEPPARSLAEVEKILNPTGQTPDTPAKIPRTLFVVLCAGPKDHGPGEHDYPLWQKRWTPLLGLAAQTTVQTADRWPTKEQLAKADVIVFYSNNPDWNAARAGELDGFLQRGGGLVYIHYAVDGHKHCDELAERIGLAWRGGQSKFRHGPLDLSFSPHSITEGMSRLQFVDESYWQLVGGEKNIILLASGNEDGKPQPLMWTRESGRGRVFVSIPGHYNWTFDDPLFRLLILRGIAWTAREPMDRFNDLVTLGARIKD